MNKLKLDRVTMICVDTLNIGNAVTSIRRSMAKVDFARVVFLTNVDLVIEGIEVIKIDTLPSAEAYSNFIFKSLSDYFDTEFCLIVQHDSWILYPEAWDDNFYKFDALGANWLYKDGRNNPQGGFALRSKKLQSVLKMDENIEICHPEDECLGRLYRKYLEKNHNIKFPTEEICNKFSFELNEPVTKTFGFHSFFWQPFKPHVVLRREGALGDLIMLMPVVDYFNNKGYQVVLDTQKQFMDIFFQHPYKIKHISEVNKNIVPEKVINFDMSYESKPQQSVLKSYYEFAGIKDGKYVNSKLNIAAGKEEMLFSKYILIHIDETGMEHRNCHGVNWDFVVKYYERLGFLVLQIGRRSHQIVAPYINTTTLQLLMFVIKGAACLVGLDSSPAHIAVALDIPAVIFFGSVDYKKRYYNFEKIIPIHSPCEKPEDDFCYHTKSGSTTGIECKYNKYTPPCTQYTEWIVIESINKLINNG